jgi:hypothetical protein
LNGSNEYVHQQASLTTGTVAYDDKLSTDFRHRDGGRVKSKGATGSREIRMWVSYVDNEGSRVDMKFVSWLLRVESKMQDEARAVDGLAWKKRPEATGRRAGRVRQAGEQDE